MKVTVELEEGVKATCEINYSTECLLITNRQSNDFEKILGRLAAEAAHRAMNNIIDFFKIHGMVVQRTVNGEAQCHWVKDVDEARRWLKSTNINLGDFNEKK